MNRLSLVPLLPIGSFSWEANLFLGLGHDSAVPLEEQRRRRWWRAWEALRCGPILFGALNTEIGAEGSWISTWPCFIDCKR